MSRNHCEGCVHYIADVSKEKCEIYSAKDFLDNKYMGECIHYFDDSSAYNYGSYTGERSHGRKWVDVDIM